MERLTKIRLKVKYILKQMENSRRNRTRVSNVPYPCSNFMGTRYGIF